MNDMTEINPNAVATIAPDPMVAMIERLVMDPNAPMDKLEQILAMQERINQTAAKAAFTVAFAAASSRFPSIPLNGSGDRNKKYALLKDIIGLTRPILSAHGLALSFSVESNKDCVTVTAELSHVGGHVKSTSIELPRDAGGSKNAVQAVGSSQTYGQRYTAQAILGLSLGNDTEDDGKAAADAGTIGPDEFIDLRSLIEESGTDEAKFCAFLNVENLEELPRKLLPNAISALRTKIRKAKAAQ